MQAVLSASKAKKTLSLLLAIAVVSSFTSSGAGPSFAKSFVEFVPRRLSNYFGNGQCEWTPPVYNISEDIKFTKTLVAGFPSGDKRLTFVQMEALTGLSARDEWDFAYLVSLHVKDSFLSYFLFVVSSTQ